MINSNSTKINIKIPIKNGQLRYKLINNITGKIEISEKVNHDLSNIEIDHNILESHYNYSYSFFEKDKDGWKAFLEKKIFPITYDCENEISYSLFENTLSEKLIIIFSSSTENNRFNYFKLFNNSNENILYLCDENIGKDPTTCSYYIGYNGINNYEVKTINLIMGIMNKLNIKKENVTLFGSSKGGFAALYYTFKYSFGSALVGSPTIYLGRIHRHTNRGKKLIRHLVGRYNNDALLFIDSLIFNAIESCENKPHIYYHVGKDEPRYSKHAVHFFDYINITNKATYELDLGDYANHSLVSEYFPIYAKKILDKNYGNVKSNN